MRFLRRKLREETRRAKVEVKDQAIAKADQKLAELTERVRMMEGTKAVITVRLHEQPNRRDRRMQATQ